MATVSVLRQVAPLFGSFGKTPSGEPNEIEVKGMPNTQPVPLVVKILTSVQVVVVMPANGAIVPEVQVVVVVKLPPL